ncbi:AAA family ATPase [Bdellovibrio bacteriovorus]|uniref:AAA family ATPase n=1 Tax=Bdellovibrio bacteriovorus TaxID=959 RepID=UPI0035A719B0
MDNNNWQSNWQQHQQTQQLNQINSQLNSINVQLMSKGTNSNGYSGGTWNNSDAAVLRRVKIFSTILLTTLLGLYLLIPTEKFFELSLIFSVPPVLIFSIFQLIPWLYETKSLSRFVKISITFTPLYFVAIALSLVANRGYLFFIFGFSLLGYFHYKQFLSCQKLDEERHALQLAKTQEIEKEKMSIQKAKEKEAEFKRLSEAKKEGTREKERRTEELRLKKEKEEKERFSIYSQVDIETFWKNTSGILSYKEAFFNTCNYILSSSLKTNVKSNTAIAIFDRFEKAKYGFKTNKEGTLKDTPSLKLVCSFLEEGFNQNRIYISSRHTDLTNTLRSQEICNIYNSIRNTQHVMKSFPKMETDEPTTWNKFLHFIEKREGIGTISDTSESNVVPQIDTQKGNLKSFDQPEAMETLERLIGLAQTNTHRKSKGMTQLEIRLHAIFSGPPGTGKTSFARKYADELQKSGILKKGHLVEVSRADLVAAYIGQTAIKTQEVIKKALGGVLFIDEAYSLITSPQDQYGIECVNTLIKSIEDAGSNLVVILAGYDNEMRDFISSNPGLKSRVSNLVQFRDFSDEQLRTLIQGKFEEHELLIEDELITKTLELVLKQKKDAISEMRERYAI